MFEVDIDINNLEEWQQRLVTEYNATYDKIIALTKFIESPAFDNIGDGEQQDLRSQRVVMLQYLSVMDSRIARFA